MATDSERKIIYHATGRITLTGVELQRTTSKFPLGETRQLEAALKESFRGQVTSLWYSRDHYPIEITIYAREHPPDPPRQPEVDPTIYA
jgi:hypothetical protein